MINSFDENKENCCGCGACAQVCPKNCIKMKEDGEGFKYPSIDASNCIECGLCETVCPIMNLENISAKEYEVRALGGWNRDENVRRDSSSGGVFSLFAEYVLSQGGVVYGCALDDDMKAVHIEVDDINDLYKLRGSKYVQSDIANVYNEVKNNLIENRYVLFSGTPCQAAGLSSFLRKKYEKLFICDFICHGVPSPLVFRKYIEFLEEKQKSKVVGFRFRNKDKKWSPTGQQMGTIIQFENGKISKNMPAYKDYFMNAFLDDVCLRPSCYNCSFKSLPKNYVDVTIADFWGLNSIDLDMCDGKGTSLVICNSLQGQLLINNVKNDFSFKEYDFERSIKRNQSIVKSVARHPNREKFFVDIYDMPFEKLAKKYMTGFIWAYHKVFKVLKNFLSK